MSLSKIWQILAGMMAKNRKNASKIGGRIEMQDKIVKYEKEIAKLQVSSNESESLLSED